MRPLTERAVYRDGYSIEVTHAGKQVQTYWRRCSAYCSKSNTWKLLNHSNFHKSSNAHGALQGFHNMCKDCYAMYESERRSKNAKNTRKTRKNSSTASSATNETNTTDNEQNATLDAMIKEFESKVSDKMTDDDIAQQIQKEQSRLEFLKKAAQQIEEFEVVNEQRKKMEALVSERVKLEKDLANKLKKFGSSTKT